MMLRITVKLSAAIPRAKPIPKIAPTKVCVVEIGKPVPDATTTVIAVANCAAKPRLGVKSVIPDPTVAITFCPIAIRPTAIPNAPKGKIHQAKSPPLRIFPPFCTIDTTEESGPIALATSLEPCANAIAQAVKSIKILKIFSTDPNDPFLAFAVNALLRK